jgi:hypothetical protein
MKDITAAGWVKELETAERVVELAQAAAGEGQATTSEMCTVALASRNKQGIPPPGSAGEGARSYMLPGTSTPQPQPMDPRFTLSATYATLAADILEGSAGDVGQGSRAPSTADYSRVPDESLGADTVGGQAASQQSASQQLDDSVRPTAVDALLGLGTTSATMMNDVMMESSTRRVSFRPFQRQLLLCSRRRNPHYHYRIA